MNFSNTTNRFLYPTSDCVTGYYVFVYFLVKRIRKRDRSIVALIISTESHLEPIYACPSVFPCIFASKGIGVLCPIEKKMALFLCVAFGQALLKLVIIGIDLIAAYFTFNQPTGRYLSSIFGTRNSTQQKYRYQNLCRYWHNSLIYFHYDYKYFSSGDCYALPWNLLCHGGEKRLKVCSKCQIYMWKS